MNRIIFILLTFFAFVHIESNAQTIDRNSVFECARVFGDSITFLNDFTVTASKRKTPEDPNGKEWEVYLMSGTVYRFALCRYSKGNPAVMKLYDDTVKEDNPYFIIKQPSKRSYYDFVCKKSAVYKVSIRLKNDKLLNQELSAIGILGFIRKFRN